MPGYLTEEQHEQQARKFAHVHAVRGGSLEEDFSRWSRGKDFQAEDACAIRRIVDAATLSMGARTATDLAEWERIGTVDRQPTTDYLLP